MKRKQKEKEASGAKGAKDLMRQELASGTPGAQPSRHIQEKLVEKKSVPQMGAG